MDCLLLLVTIYVAILLPHTQGVPAIPEEPRAGLQRTVDDVGKESSLGQVLEEYMADIETVEAAASSCSKGHREQHLKISGHLETALRRCQVSSGNTTEALKRCVEDETQRDVSDIRQRINTLKTCLDALG